MFDVNEDEGSAVLEWGPPVDFSSAAAPVNPADLRYAVEYRVVDGGDRRRSVASSSNMSGWLPANDRPIAERRLKGWVSAY